ncbi:C-type lectin domain family 2 member D-like [Alligator sinensis]|uniref:C-type lectin domain family 2 member D-like n=1 Tax=Alligator sinensis TaxID=38654 RepID=A0A1U7SHG6_ALLSI|nr:C-type lectin domain family 2 member D-like [Alligator sinensis]
MGSLKMGVTALPNKGVEFPVCGSKAFSSTFFLEHRTLLVMEGEATRSGLCPLEVKHHKVPSLHHPGRQEQREEPGYKFRKTAARRTLIAAAAAGFTTGLAVAAVVLAAMNAKLCLDRADFPAAATCPDDWLGYQGKCYFFSKNETTWNNSQSLCASQGATLAGIDTEHEKSFLIHHKGILYHWIGLWREPGQAWTWANGSMFDNKLEVRGGGNCAYLNDEGIGSSSCTTKKNWICARARV